MVQSDGTLNLSMSVSKYLYNVLESANAIDKNVFWGTTYGAPVAWAFFLFLSIIRFKIGNITICLISLVLTGSNALGYYKCARDHDKKVKAYIFEAARNNISAEQMAKLGGYAAKYALGSTDSAR